MTPTHVELKLTLNEAQILTGILFSAVTDPDMLRNRKDGAAARRALDKLYAARRAAGES